MANYGSNFNPHGTAYNSKAKQNKSKSQGGISKKLFGNTEQPNYNGGAVANSVLNQMTYFTLVNERESGIKN
ncbi:MAG: hypothetical protein ACMG6E_09280 [Candidatus Roizmanbacteria bacterium]